MSSYETLFILNPNLAEEDVEAMAEKIKAIIANDGEVLDVEQWGKKRLAYEIEKVRDGYYTLIKFNAQPAILEELNHVYRINENILRGIVVKNA